MDLEPRAIKLEPPNESAGQVLTDPITLLAKSSFYPCSFTSVQMPHRPNCVPSIWANMASRDVAIIETILAHTLTCVCMTIGKGASGHLPSCEPILYTPSVSNQKLRFRKSMGLRLFFAFLAQHCVHCIVLTKRFLVS